MKFTATLNAIVFALAVLILGFALMTWLRVPVGGLGDWVVGLLAGAWLLAVVVVPWDVHFKARAVLADAGPTRDRGLAVDDRQVAYVRRVATASLWVAIGLHVGSAAVLFDLARTGVSRVGYPAAVLALLLTALRPAAAAYRYLADRLHAIGEQWKYPVADVVELRSRVDAAEVQLKGIDRDVLDADNADSLAATAKAAAAANRDAIAAVSAELAEVKAANAADHDRLAREARSAVAQLSADGQFLDHVRELIRFWKQA